MFGAAIKEYNETQKRKDRKITNYYNKIKDEQNKSYCYEMIAQVGNYKSKPSEELQEKILKEFFDEFKNKYPNMKIVGGVIHQDESGCQHLHLDYIPIKHCEKGLKCQVSMSGALREMGYEDKGKFSEQPLIYWTRDCNNLLEGICNKYGLEIIHPEREKSIEKKQKHQAIKSFRDDKILEDLQSTFDELSHQNEEIIKEISKNKNEYIDKYNTYKINVEKMKENLNKLEESHQQRIDKLDNDYKEVFNDLSNQVEEQKQEIKKQKEEIEYYKNLDVELRDLSPNNKGKKGMLGKKTYSEEEYKELYETAYSESLKHKDERSELLDTISNLRYQKDAIKNDKTKLNNELDYYKKKSSDNSYFKKFFEFLEKKGYDLSKLKNDFEEHLKSLKKNKNNDIGFHK